tara:strand:- start:4452 stop:6080 length:1629 start_codon:yes stop_codon:yes gene_type:complete
MDFGVYGGEANTPNIDQLAKQGTMFTNYHTSPSCAPSRAMLLTGYDSHLTGVPNLPLFLPPDQVEEPGYEGILNDSIKTVATQLKKNGYNTYITGKWHLGHTQNTLPSKRGFKRSYILDASGADNYVHKAYLPTQLKPKWFKDGASIELPKDFYSSRNLVDEMMQFMEEEPNKENPFFAYLAFQAIHIPVQAPKEFIEKYEGVYDEGWDVLRQFRFEKAKELDLIPKEATLGKMLPTLSKWETLSAENKKLKAKAMAVNAAMLEAMDFHIGRYKTYLKEHGKLANTVFIITSDNGPEASDPSLVAGMGLWLKYAGYNTDYETLGEKDSWNFIGPGFASAAASPNSFFKFYAGEGGLRVPLIISGAHLPKGQKKHAISFVTDVTPTILELANIKTAPPLTKPYTGKTLYALINNETDIVHDKEEVIGIEAAGHAALFKGDFKITRNGPSYGDFKWRLYNLKNDPGETNDLALSSPKTFKDLLSEYDVYAANHNVLEMAEDYDLMLEIQRKFKVKILKTLVPIVLGFLFISFFFYRRKKRRRRF